MFGREKNGNFRGAVGGASPKNFKIGGRGVKRQKHASKERFKFERPLCVDGFGWCSCESFTRSFIITTAAVHIDPFPGKLLV
jgi:hypothetical protein